ncbi:hypothetical protein DGMP_24840 [Desulfomarina profundi]|uniref:CN hydrolase domain-containing protein n=1 Tax=Desulfomarina profundi TaxID=2772557 RepID=A0A8D5JS68_9BACT|nr:carbon-nitrogen hydrolase family protein [Desulfomarina profundi]BCL61791.1 hypothetical protein DGMP_24840 [Desulfomarina profundi]
MVEKKFSTQNDNLTVGIANINSEAGNLQANQAAVVSALDQFLSEKVNIAIFPEFCLSGYFFEPEGDCQTFMENATFEKLSSWLNDLTARYINDTLQVIVLNGLEKVSTEQGYFYDTTLLLDKNGYSLSPEKTYKKTFLPSFEKKFCRSGINDTLVMETLWGKFGVLTCYDVCFAPLINDLVYNHQIDGLIVTAAWRKQGERMYPELGIKDSTYHQTQWETILPALAGQNQIWLMAANSVGPHSIKGLDYCGRSGTWAPSGINMIMGSDSEEQLLILHNIDIQGTLSNEREPFGVLRDYSELACNRGK